ncbi:MAG TPA: tetratricopeptide repeat protein [Acidobacteriaceae bacterium]|jgi:tetratricopeptide (TPR) repeat protein|nr:tetratricopeptide repeat protein [Acidobacteriaceae bacterium]
MHALSPEERGDLLMIHHEYVEATQAYSVAPTSAAVLNKLGVAWHHLLAIRAARREYEKALRLQPNFPDALNNLGATYFAEQDYGKAVELYRRALGLAPQSAVITANLGTAYFALDKAKEGAAAYRSAYALDPTVFDMSAPQIVQGASQKEELARLDYCLAELFARSNEVDRAVDYLEKAYDAGYVPRKQVMQEPAFAAVRGTPQFAEFLAEARVR